MLHTLSCIISTEIDPRHNLALEETLLRQVAPGQCILYLWQNQRTVVIGRNQHPSNECRTQALDADGGHLVRRLSGGGAVYQDLGNLNFTFLTCLDDYDVEKQTETILTAVRALGVPAEKTGRNDLTAEGGKFSGHAYYRSGDHSYHHGTLMVDVDLAPLERYLSVHPLKLQAKGVPSVRARVVNLRHFCPTLTIPQLRQALIDAFGQVYGMPVQPLTLEGLDQALFAESLARFSDPVWTYGQDLPLDISREAAFDWGLLRLDFSQTDGTITQAALWSDGLAADFLCQVPAALTGCPLDPGLLRQRLLALPEAEANLIDDILTLLIKE